MLRNAWNRLRALAQPSGVLSVSEYANSAFPGVRVTLTHYADGRAVWRAYVPAAAAGGAIGSRAIAAARRMRQAESRLDEAFAAVNAAFERP